MCKSGKANASRVWQESYEWYKLRLALAVYDATRINSAWIFVICGYNVTNTDLYSDEETLRASVPKQLLNRPEWTKFISMDKMCFQGYCLELSYNL